MKSAGLKSGYTVVEILIVISLLALVFAAGYNVFLSSYRSVRSGEEKLYNIQAAALVVESLRTELTSLSKLERVKFESDGSGIEFEKMQMDASGKGKPVEVSYKYDPVKKNVVKITNDRKVLLGHGRIEGFKITTNYEKNKMKFPTWIKVEVVTTRAREESKSSEVALSAVIYPRMVNRNLQIREAGASYSTD